jgi:hypothetical protein
MGCSWHTRRCALALPLGFWRWCGRGSSRWWRCRARGLLALAFLVAAGGGGIGPSRPGSTSSEQQEAVRGCQRGRRAGVQRRANPRTCAGLAVAVVGVQRARRQSRVSREGPGGRLHPADPSCLGLLLCSQHSGRAAHRYLAGTQLSQGAWRGKGQPASTKPSQALDPLLLKARQGKSASGAQRTHDTHGTARDRQQRRRRVCDSNS